MEKSKSNSNKINDMKLWLIESTDGGEKCLVIARHETEADMCIRHNFSAVHYTIRSIDIDETNCGLSVSNCQDPTLMEESYLKGFNNGMLHSGERDE